MAVDLSQAVTFKISTKSLKQIDKLAQDYDLSRANMVVKLVEAALLEYGEVVENSTVTQNGARNGKNVASVIRDSARKFL